MPSEAKEAVKVTQGDESLRGQVLDIIHNRLEAEHVGTYIAGMGNAADEIAALITRHREEAEKPFNAIKAALVDDPEWIATGISDDAVEAGMEVFRQVDRDNENYIAGETTDWDEGMIVAAIFKSVVRAIIQENCDGE